MTEERDDMESLADRQARDQSHTRDSKGAITTETVTPKKADQGKEFTND